MTRDLVSHAAIVVRHEAKLSLRRGRPYPKKEEVSDGEEERNVR